MSRKEWASIGKKAGWNGDANELKQELINNGFTVTETGTMFSIIKKSDFPEFAGEIIDIPSTKGKGYYGDSPSLVMVRISWQNSDTKYIRNISNTQKVISEINTYIESHS